MCRNVYVFGLLLISGAAAGCGDGSTEADRLGVGAQCTEAAECRVEMSFELDCLTRFQGGYCGLAGCQGDTDCPEGSACVTHDDLENYCFRICLDKPECNLNRAPENESNCSANIDFVDPQGGLKACVPPSSGL